MPNMLTRQLDDLLLIALGSRNPSDAEWDEAVVHSKRQLELRGDVSKCGALVFTDGGSPSSKQRQALRAIYGEKPPPMALITESFAARAAVSVFTIFWPSSNAVFGPGDWDKALRHVGLAEARHAAVARELRSMEVALGTLHVARPFLTHYSSDRASQ